MPNRVIKESICYSEDLDQLTPFEETAFYRLMVRVDDYGRCDARPAFLKSMLFSTKADVSVQMVADAVESMARVGVIRLYEVGGRRYLYFPNWSKHQRIRNSKQKYPAPPEGDAGENGKTPDVFADDSPEDDAADDLDGSDSHPRGGASPSVDGNLQQCAASCGNLPRVAANSGEARQAAAESSEAPQAAAYTRAGAESESESRIRIENPESESRIRNPEERKKTLDNPQQHAHARTRDIVEIPREYKIGDGLRPACGGHGNRSPNGQLIPRVEIDCDENWRYSERARMATAQLVVDEIKARRLPAMRHSDLFDEIVAGLKAGITPEEIVGYAHDSESPTRFSVEIQSAIMVLDRRRKLSFPPRQQIPR